MDEPTNNLDIHSIQWLEDVLNERNSTMIIISHDRHFLNSVCTHMADLDYGELRIYPGNYDDFMLAASEARARLMAANAKSKERVSELQEFVRRFAANKSKAKQATSRRKLIEKFKAMPSRFGLPPGRTLIFVLSKISSSIGRLSMCKASRRLSKAAAAR